MENIAHIAEHVLEHSVSDTLYLIPFLFVTYLLMEWLEHKTAGRTQEAIRHAGAAGPVGGALLGVVPQCGFSAMAATLWAGRVITLGTLFALAAACARAASDAEARADHAALKAATESEGLLGDLAADSSAHGHGCCAHDHSHDHDHGWKGIVKSALVHTVQVTVFIFVITLALNAVLEVVGEDVLADFLGANPTVSVLASALVGLIPNCAASVVIAELYLEGVLGSGAMLAGLLVSAGVGLLVLVRANRHWRQNLAIVAGLYVTGVIWGLIATGLGVTF